MSFGSDLGKIVVPFAKTLDSQDNVNKQSEYGLLVYHETGTVLSLMLVGEGSEGSLSFCVTVICILLLVAEFLCSFMIISVSSFFLH